MAPWHSLRVKAGRIGFQRVRDSWIGSRGRESMIRRIVVEKTKVVIVLPTPHRTHYAGFGRIPEDETVTVVVNDEQPMLPAISPLILKWE
jgi:hypothetical protein